MHLAAVERSLLKSQLQYSSVLITMIYSVAIHNEYFEGVIKKLFLSKY